MFFKKNGASPHGNLLIDFQLRVNFFQEKFLKFLKKFNEYIDRKVQKNQGILFAFVLIKRNKMSQIYKILNKLYIKSACVFF